MNRSDETHGSGVGRAETVIYDGDEALANAQGLLDAEEERRVRRRREHDITHFSSWGDGPFARRRSIQSAEALPVNDAAPANLRGAGVCIWAGLEPLSAVPAPPEPGVVRRRQRESAAAHIVSDVVPACIRRAKAASARTSRGGPASWSIVLSPSGSEPHLRSWSGPRSRSAVPTSPQPEIAQLFLAAPAVPEVPEVEPIPKL